MTVPLCSSRVGSEGPQWPRVADNLLVRIEGDGVNHTTVRDVLRRLAEPSFWSSGEMRRALADMVPEYRLSRFQFALPARAAAEVLGDYQLDFDGAAGFWQALRVR